MKIVWAYICRKFYNKNIKDNFFSYRYNASDTKYS